uniref:PH domain-containing protein n=1 Tax=Zosterops lateralis melanops TaxID=1220523 RepID=A0A8D2PSE0_ZOSLA
SHGQPREGPLLSQKSLGSESWEVVEEPRGRGSPGRQPQRHEGYLLKKRKWPLKGWHKRYFVLENGILKYSTTRQDVLKGKLHGAIDVRQSVMSVNKKAQRVDLDTEDNIYHLKIKSPEVFSSWVSSLCSHHHGERPEPCPPGGPDAQVGDSPNPNLNPNPSPKLSECQAKLQELTGMLQHLEALHRIPSAPLISGAQVRGAQPGEGCSSAPLFFLGKVHLQPPPLPPSPQVPRRGRRRAGGAPRSGARRASPRTTPSAG